MELLTVAPAAQEKYLAARAVAESIHASDVERANTERDSAVEPFRTEYEAACLGPQQRFDLATCVAGERSQRELAAKRTPEGRVKRRYERAIAGPLRRFERETLPARERYEAQVAPALAAHKEAIDVAHGVLSDQLVEAWKIVDPDCELFAESQEDDEELRRVGEMELYPGS